MIERVTVEKVDEESRFVVKRVQMLNGGLFFGRQMPINNSMFACEKSRKYYNKPILDCPIQLHHIHPKVKGGSWHYDDSFHLARQHAKENKRIFIAYHQRTQNQIEKIDWDISMDDFTELCNQGLTFLPLFIPMSATSEEVTTHYALALSQLKGNQQIIPIISANHNILYFSRIIQSFFGKNFMIGIHFASPKSSADCLHNLLELMQINASIPENSDTSLIIGFCTEKFYEKMKVSGSFVSTTFGIDIPSQRLMTPYQIKAMMYGKSQKEISDEIEPEYVYLRFEGGFSSAQQQIAWYEDNLNEIILSGIPISAGLTRLQAIWWSNFLGQQEDFKLINETVLQSIGMKKLIETKSRWCTYIDNFTQSIDS